MKLEKFYLLLSVMIIVFLAGCAKQESISVAGVVIEKFTPQVSTIASNSPIEFTLIVKNIGEREATDVKAVLGGLIFSLDTEDEIERLKYWKLNAEKVFKPLDPDKLLGEDLESGLKGDQGIVIWRFRAPTQTRDQTYEPTLNLVYNYSTVSTVLIKSVNFDYLQSLPENEQKSIDTGIVVSKITKGPIEIFVKSDQAIISGSSTLPIEIEFKNVGGGRTFVGGGKEIDPKETDPSILYTNIKGGLDRILVELPSDMHCNLKSEDGKYKIRLIEGKSGRILCNKVIGEVATTKTFSLDIKAEYRYLVEGKTTVKVSKTLYQPPIVDISLEDSSATIEYDHSTKSMHAVLDFKIKNVGNQPIRGTDVNIKYTIPEAGVTDVSEPVLPSSFDQELFELASFEIYPPANYPIKVSVPISGSPKEITYTLQTDPPKLLSKSSAIPNETNDRNNQKSDTVPLDYDLAVTDLKAELANPNNPDDFSIKITTKIKNNGNVNQINIPFIVTASSGVQELNFECEIESSGESLGLLLSRLDNIKRLEKGKEEKVNCIYSNPNKKLSFTIEALAATGAVDKYIINNYQKTTFEIKYDIAIVKGSSKFIDAKIDQNKVTYTLSTKVKNVGVVTAKDATVKFVNTSGASVCKTDPAKPNIVVTLTPGKETTVTCDTNPIQILAGEKIEVTAKVISSVKEIEPHEPNEESFYLLPPDTTPPKLSDGSPLGVVTTDSSTLSLKTNESATCRYSTTANIQYDVMTKSFTQSEKGVDNKYPHTTPLSNLAHGDYTYYVKCADVFNNKNTEDFRIAFIVSTTPETTITATKSVYPYNPYESDTWSNSNIEIQFSCQTTRDTNECIIRYCYDTQNACEPDKNYDMDTRPTLRFVVGEKLYFSDIVINEGIPLYLRYYSLDYSLNKKEPTESFVIKIDKTLPDISEDTTDGQFKTIKIRFGEPTIRFTGHVKDSKTIGSGLDANSTKFYLKRSADVKYWTGSGWSSTVTWLSTKHQETTGDTSVEWGSSSPLPTSWESGEYIAVANITDRAGNSILGNSISFGM